MFPQFNFTTLDHCCHSPGGQATFNSFIHSFTYLLKGKGRGAGAHIEVGFFSFTCPIRVIKFAHKYLYPWTVSSGHRLHLEHLREPGFLARIVLVLRKGRANIRIIESRKRIPTFQKLLRSGSMCYGAWGCIWGNKGKTHTLMERKECWEARNIGRLTKEICKDQVDSAQERNLICDSARGL